MSAAKGNYYLPEPSPWPLAISIGLFLLALGFILFLHSLSVGPWLMLVGGVVVIYMVTRWFSQVISESEAGNYNDRVDMSFRWGMGWFIFSEIMFFAAFFGALFYVRQFSVPWLGGGLEQALLWQGFEAGWPTAGPAGPTAIPPDSIAGVDQFSPMAAWGIPFLNTLILLSSGATVTWAHWGVKIDNRGQLITGLFLTVFLGITFLSLQVYEYAHAYMEMGLTLKAGIYGTTFFMLTGFHGLHVTIGTIMLIVILGRSVMGHFSAQQHFGFEAVAWYWHFVDVVWLSLFIFVYWL